MQRNLEVTKGAILTEAVMMALARKGMGRQRAHEVLRGISVRVFNEGIPLRDLLYKTPEVTAYLSRKEIDELTEPNKYLGRVRQLIDRAVRYAKSV
jgi:adenylosuccinate lyase